MPYHASRLQISFLNSRSSRAIRLFLLHLDLTAAVIASCIFFLSVTNPSTTQVTNKGAQSNFLASFLTLHNVGSCTLKALISAISVSVTWYRFSLGSYIEGGSRASVDDAFNFLRSLLGRKMFGVCMTFGMLGGGLWMMWSCCSVLEGRKATSGFMLSLDRVLRAED